MKTFLSTTATALLLSVISTQSHAISLATELCNSIAEDNKKQFRLLIETNELDIKEIFTNARCSGKNLLVFATRNKSVATGAMIIRKIRKTDISDNMSSLKKGPERLLIAANKRL